VFHRNTWINRLFSVAFLLLIAGCGDLGGGCGGCGLTALPEGGLPRDQTVEGGGQIRLTAQGFDRIASVVPSLLDSLLGEGVCIDRGSILGTGYCVDTLPACGRPACQAKLSLAALDIEPVGSGTLRLHVNADVDAPIRIDPLIGSNCTLTASATYNPSNGQRGFGFDAEVTFTIKPDTGELDFSVSRVHSLDLADVDIASDGSFACGGLEILGDLARIIIDSFLGDWIIDAFLRPTITNLVKGFLPDPLGIANRLDLGALLGGAIPGIEASLEARFVPGGYVQTSNGGLSLGLITGINADRDIATRTADLDSEPALCVPPFQAPALGAAPASLPTTARGTFSLLPAEEFLGGQFEPPTDLAIGISETTLDLGGHHAVTSGALCAAIGTDLVDLLNVGTLGILVPSLNDLVSPEGKEPVLLALRPQNPMDLSVGEGTAASPAIKIHVEDMEADFYAFVYERYVRVFTMSLTLDIELNVEFNQVPGQPATIKPLLKTIEASDVAIEVLNHEFVRESKDTIKGVLPTVMKLVLDLIPGLLSNPIEVPNFAGFTLTNLQLRKVTTPSDDFLAIYASLGSLTPALAALAPEVAAR
jgi:hypothetical protein